MYIVQSSVLLSDQVVRWLGSDTREVHPNEPQVKLRYTHQAWFFLPRMRWWHTVKLATKISKILFNRINDHCMMGIVYTLVVGLFPPYLCNLFSTDWSNHKPLMLKLPDFSLWLKSFHNTAIGILGKAWQKYKLVQRLPVGSPIYWLWCLIVICDVRYMLLIDICHRLT